MQPPESPVPGGQIFGPVAAQIREEGILRQFPVPGVCGSFLIFSLLIFIAHSGGKPLGALNKKAAGCSGYRGVAMAGMLALCLKKKNRYR